MVLRLLRRQVGGVGQVGGGGQWPSTAVAAATCGRDQVGAAALALPALEVAVGGGRGALPRRELVGVHAQAHRATRVPPFGAGRREDLVQALVHGLQPRPAPSRARPASARRRRPCGPPARRRRRAGPRCGRWCTSRGRRCPRGSRAAAAGGQTHVLQRLFGRERSAGSLVRRPGPAPRRKRHALAGVGAPGDERGQRGGVDDDLGSKAASSSVRSVRQYSTAASQSAPWGACARPFQVGEGGLVRGDHAGAGARLDRHVADGHPGLHRELLDGGAAVLDDVALPAAGADLRDDGEDQVLGGDALGQFAVDGDGHGLERAMRQRLGGQHVLDLAGADAEGQRAEGAVGGGVASRRRPRSCRAGSGPAAGRPRARCPARRRPAGAGGRRTRRSSCAASRSGCARPGRRSACRCRGSGCCGPRWRG